MSRLPGGSPELGGGLPHFIPAMTRLGDAAARFGTRSSHPRSRRTRVGSGCCSGSPNPRSSTGNLFHFPKFLLPHSIGPVSLPEVTHHLMLTRFDLTWDGKTMPISERFGNDLESPSEMTAPALPIRKSSIGNLSLFAAH